VTTGISKDDGDDEDAIDIEPDNPVDISLLRSQFKDFHFLARTKLNLRRGFSS
jgi:hypothetical protein